MKDELDDLETARDVEDIDETPVVDEEISGAEGFSQHNSQEEMSTSPAGESLSQKQDKPEKQNDDFYFDLKREGEDNIAPDLDRHKASKVGSYLVDELLAPTHLQIFEPFSGNLLDQLRAGGLVIACAPQLVNEISQASLRAYLGDRTHYAANTSGIGVSFPGSLIQLLQDESATKFGGCLYVPLDKSQFFGAGNKAPDLGELRRLLEEQCLTVLLSIAGKSVFDLRSEEFGASGIPVVEVDWVSAWFAQQQFEDLIEKSTLERLTKRVKRTIGQNGFEDKRVSDALRRFFSDFDLTATAVEKEFQRRVDEIVKRNQPVHERAFAERFDDGWASKPAKLLLTLATLAAESPEGLGLEAAIDLGSKILADESLLVPHVQQIETRTGSAENYEVQVAKPVNVRADLYWYEKFDFLLRHCSLYVKNPAGKRWQAKPGRQIIQFNDEEDAEIFLRLFPSTIAYWGEKLLEVYPACSSSVHDGGSTVRTVSDMLSGLADLQPDRFGFERFWERTIDGLAYQENAAPSDNVFQLMYRAFPATRLLYLYWKLKTDLNEDARKKVLEFARSSVARRVANTETFEPFRGAIFSLLYLCIEDGYPIAQTTSSFLRILVGDEAKRSVVDVAERRLKAKEDRYSSPAEDAISLIRQILRFVVREKLEVRVHLLLDHYAHRQNAPRTNYYLELLYVRLVYDAVFRDFSANEVKSDETLGARVFRDLAQSDTSELLPAIWSAKLNLLDITTRHGERWFIDHVAKVLSSSFPSFSSGMVGVPDVQVVHRILRSALEKVLSEQIEQSDQLIYKAWQETEDVALKTAILDTIDGKPRDSVADTLFSQASLARAAAVSRWPFLALGERFEPEDIEKARASIVAFSAKLSEHLDRSERRELRRHWQTLRKVLSECGRFTVSHLEMKSEKECLKDWISEKRDELNMLLDGLSDPVTDVAVREKEA